MQVFKCPPRIFGARIALAALVAPALFAAPPAAAQDFRSVTAKAIIGAVSGMSEAKADPGLDQAGGAGPVRPEQASRQEQPSPEPVAGQNTPPDAPAQP